MMENKTFKMENKTFKMENKTFKIGDRVTHKLYPEFGIGIVKYVGTESYVGFEGVGVVFENKTRSSGGEYKWAKTSEHKHTWLSDERYLEHAQDNVKIIQNGRTVIAIRGNKKGIARCNPNDEFNIHVGIKLALERLEEQEKSFIPKHGTSYYCHTKANDSFIQESFFMSGWFTDEINKAIGNAFRNAEEAKKADVEAIHEKMNKVIAYAKTL